MSVVPFNRDTETSVDIPFTRIDDLETAIDRIMSDLTRQDIGALAASFEAMTNRHIEGKPQIVTDVVQDILAAAIQQKSLETGLPAPWDSWAESDAAEDETDPDGAA